MPKKNSSKKNHRKHTNKKANHKLVGKHSFARVVLKSVLILCILAGLAGGAFIAYQVSLAPDISEIDATPEGYRTTILDKNGNVIENLSMSESNRVYVELEQIPDHLEKAFVAIEDERFYEHGGIDIKGIVRAGVKGIANGFKFTQGASTITQQLLKNNVFTGWMEEETFYDSLSRKVQEWYLAIRLEKEYEKDWILENYLNTINLGGGTRGVYVAAQYYFGKDVSELSLAQSALIAGITKNPSAYDPIKNADGSMDRQRLVLDAMLKNEFITQEEYDAAILENVISKLNTESVNGTVQVLSWFEDAMLNQIVKDLMTEYTYDEAQAWNLLYSGGLTIYSTMDPALQEICETVTADSSWYSGKEEVSVVMTDVSTGAVNAIVGGRNEKTSSLVYNRATDAARQPGSTIKVIGEYAAGIDTGALTLASVMDDAPYAYSNGSSIHNAYSSYKGRTTIREAIANSSNIIALKAFQTTGAEKVYEYLQKFGLTTLTEEDKNEALSIGGTHNGVTNLEMTAAYNAIANDGVYVEPYYYTQVVDQKNNVILQHAGEGAQVISAEAANLLTEAMEDVMTTGTGRAAAVSGLTLAGKSGTTNGNKDLWFIGYSSYYTCGIWGGFDDNSDQESGNYVKKIWQGIMKQAHDGKKNAALVNKENLSKATICKKCGNLAVEGLCDNTVQGNMTRTEYFMAGTKPTQSCDCHMEVEICQESGMKLGQFCPFNADTKAIYLKSGTPGTEDAAYVMPEELNAECTLHTEFWDILIPSSGTQEQENGTNPEDPQSQENAEMEDSQQQEDTAPENPASQEEGWINRVLDGVFGEE